ncbi:hypothetical protein L208DRAFT_1291845 [Tricholoma matsutake]|nr:hypothetical protein L208DRAFT_1291845 [Tricholoma matsutake 945]
MSSLRLQDTILLAEQHPELSFGQVQQFISLASRLKDDILLAQPSSVLVFDPPDVLPPTVSTFLQNSCGISMACVEACWDTLKTMIWHDAQSLEDSLIHDFSVHGHSLGLFAHTLYPLQHTCTNPILSAPPLGATHQKEEQWQAVLYTMDKGVLPVHSVHLYCDECKTSYRHNFWVNEGVCTYYNGIPAVIQVGEHQFAEKWLVQLWITLMLVSWQVDPMCSMLYHFIHLDLSYQLCTAIQSLAL